LLFSDLGTKWCFSDEGADEVFLRYCIRKQQKIFSERNLKEFKNLLTPLRADKSTMAQGL
jgi:asparagine synthetase B (glutamine-hydrolysing)